MESDEINNSGIHLHLLPPCQHPEFAERQPVYLVVPCRRRGVVRPPPGGALLEVATQLCLDAPECMKDFE